MRVGAAFLLLLLGAAQAREIPIADFFRLPQYEDMQIAPDGKHLAALAPVNGRQNLVLLDLGGRKAVPITSSDAIDVVWFQWINSRRLVFYVATLNERDDDSRNGEYIAIDLDGKSPYRLSERPRDAMGRRALMGDSVLLTVARPLRFVRALPGETDDVIVQEAVVDYQGRWGGGTLFRVNSRTGAQQALGLGKPDTGEFEDWVVDNRACPAASPRTARGWWRCTTARAPTRIGSRCRSTRRSRRASSLLAVDEEAAGLYVTAYKDRDTGAIYRWSASGRALGDSRWRPIRRSTSRACVYDEGQVVGVSYEADLRARHGSTTASRGCRRPSTPRSPVA